MEIWELVSKKALDVIQDTKSFNLIKDEIQYYVPPSQYSEYYDYRLKNGLWVFYSEEYDDLQFLSAVDYDKEIHGTATQYAEAIGNLLYSDTSEYSIKKYLDYRIKNKLKEFLNER